MNYESISDIGLLRQANEDAYRNYEGEDFLLLVVCDGMGGHKAGEVASRLASDRIIEYFEQEFNEENNICDEMQKAVDAANKKVYDTSEEHPEMSNMGTTVVFVLVKDDIAFIGNVGDSRCYVLNKYGFKQVSKDHSLVNDLLTSGTITEQEAEVYPRKNVITRSVGVAAEVEADIVAMDLSDGDMVLLCSDGLNNQVDEENMEEILKEDTSLNEKLEEFVELANDYGGIDNVTVTVYRHGGEDR